jgi:hypothetical protein
MNGSLHMKAADVHWRAAPHIFATEFCALEAHGKARCTFATRAIMQVWAASTGPQGIWIGMDCFCRENNVPQAFGMVRNPVILIPGHGSTQTEQTIRGEKGFRTSGPSRPGPWCRQAWTGPVLLLFCLRADYIVAMRGYMRTSRNLKGFVS